MGGSKFPMETKIYLSKKRKRKKGVGKGMWKVPSLIPSRQKMLPIQKKNKIPIFLEDNQCSLSIIAAKPSLQTFPLKDWSTMKPEISHQNRSQPKYTSKWVQKVPPWHNSIHICYLKLFSEAYLATKQHFDKNQYNQFILHNHIILINELSNDVIHIYISEFSCNDANMIDPKISDKKIWYT